VAKGGIVGVICSPKKVKLFCGIITSDEKISQKSFITLEEKFGEIDTMSDVILFDFSDYYCRQMGDNLKRFWISFKKLVSAADLSKIKVFTNSVESSFSLNGKRCVNIDPGYVSLANVVLATTKNYSHRIYLSDGIYGEVTTIYKKNGFIKLPWSYPDYLSKTAVDFLLKARVDLVKQLRAT
jgi:hypothetical protein